MATVYITEFAGPAKQEGFASPVSFPQQPPLAEQTVAITAGSVQSAAFNAGTQLVEITTDAICSIAIGANPTATATTRRMAANTTATYGVRPGQKVAVITNT